MPVPLVRSAQFLAFLVAAALAVAGALALRAPGLVAVLVTAAVIGAVSAGMACELPGVGRARLLDVGGHAAGWTAGVLLVVSGLAALAGAGVMLLVAAAVAAVAGSVHLRRVRARSRRAARPTTMPRPAPRPPAPAPLRPVGRALSPPPVGGSTARALGEEWLRTAALLEARIDPALRRSVVQRREAILDELERRDGTGFARWLADLPSPGSNPAAHVRDLPAAGTDAA